ncbi:polyprenyl diphosphate synthase [Candidatus Methanarcanum hacksteinii]|uniref:polyprenyl diphosphate synthase n=1 Tax=Candidatus Methanarcanum hacksteinii TaxID=2911857 RepID=UPI0037DC365D
MGFTDFVSNATYDLYEAKLEKEVLEGQMPKHVAIIMDGNRRYAKDVLKTDDTSEGHRRGKDKVEEVLNWCLKLNIRVLTIYALSTENFSREDSEVDYLLKLIIETMYELADDERVHKNRIHVRMIGDRELAPEQLMDAVKCVEERTKDYENYRFNIAVAYGGRQEIVSAVKEVARKVKDGSIDISDIDESSISGHLYTSDDPDPDLVLRTSGELRLSNFLIWQLAYSELYFTDVYWPGFRYIDFLRAIRSYQQRSRRYGT